MVAVRRTRRLSPGRRNLLERLVHSRAARDLRHVGRHILAGLALWFVLVGVWVSMELFIDWLAPTLARMFGWI